VNRERAIPGLAFVVALTGVLVGFLSLTLNSLEAFPVPFLAAHCFALLLLYVYACGAGRERDTEILLLLVFSMGCAVALRAMPEYLYGFQVNGIVHRSFFSAILLLCATLPGARSSLYYLLGATPSAGDISRYPLLLFPVLLALVAYALLLERLVAMGLPHLDWAVVSAPYQSFFSGDDFIRHAGMRNHILGTFLLIALTSLISVPIGVGVGVFLNEYPLRGLSQVVRLSTTVLRSMSVFILGITAFSLVAYSRGTFLSDIFSGYYYDIAGQRHTANGSFFTAALILSLLVIPVVARATEDGCRSVPTEVREGSLALGASDGYGLVRVILPWALPNIVTALLLGCAEAAGSVAVLMFIARTGEYGMNPFGEVTSLSYLIFDSQYGLPELTDLMRPYQFSAALVLLTVTTGLTAVSLVIKRSFAERYRGRG
jgi:phosphate transport system permease protein